MTPNKLSVQHPYRDIPSLARFITLLESDPAAGRARLRTLDKKRKPALRIGITGPAGSGKSTLINKLIPLFRAKKKTVAVIAVDPSSPISGGAFLGDRIRMLEHARDKGVFIRSMANRAALGGAAPMLADVLVALEMFGFDVILMETIGAGQSDTALRPLCDTLLVLAPPESVDIVQAMKSGLMEIGDIFVIHKADLPGAEHAAKIFRESLSLRPKGDMPVVCVSSRNDSGLKELMKHIEACSRTRSFGRLMRPHPSVILSAAKDLALDHVAIAVRSIKNHLPLYTKKLGIAKEGITTFQEYGVRIASLKLPNARIELIEPTGPKSTLVKFLAKRGEGLHHIAFRVPNLPSCVTKFKKRGLAWVDEKPRRGLHDSRICFLHPSSTNGILLEFVEA